MNPTGSSWLLCVIAAVGLVSCAPKPTATREDRLKWNLASLTNGYASAGHKNSQWDEDAREALTDFARAQAVSDDEAQVLSDLAGGAAENAMDAGCDDPMVRYISVRDGSDLKARPLGDRQEAYRVAARDLEHSVYPPLRKFYANAAAAEILYVQRDTNRWPLVRQLRGDAVADLNQAFQDPTLPEADAYEATEAVFAMLSRNTAQLTNAYDTLAATLADQASKGSKRAVGALVKAEFNLQYAWRARGNGTADRVTAEGWRLFGERLAEAETALNQAWALDPYDAQIPTLMISVACGQQKPRAEMEVWFQRAMKLDPDNYAACHAKLHFLLPQWYGSREDMLEFGRQCVAATNWGGQVPMILVNAHSEYADGLAADSRADYWRQPEVWPDIKSAYERFARAEPDATKFRYPYAAYAFRCGQWQDFKDQIQLIRQNEGKVRDAYFGGKDNFDKMLEQAKPAPATP